MIIGAQFYTLREFCKTTENLEKSLVRVADMGYRAVQLSGVCEYDPAWMAALLKKLGLVCPVTHTAPDKILHETDAVIAAHETIGAPYIGLGSAPGIFKKENEITECFDRFFADFTPVVRKIVASGKQFFYHNHNAEFARDKNGKNMFDRLTEAFTPAECGLLLDTYWITAGGGDPAAFLRRYSGRTACIHFKDMSYDAVERKVQMAPVGRGNLNWEAIFAAAADTDVKYAFIEQDNCYGEDPFDCLAESLAFCRANGFEE